MRPRFVPNTTVFFGKGHGVLPMVIYAIKRIFLHIYFYHRETVKLELYAPFTDNIYNTGSYPLVTGVYAKMENT